MRLWLIITAALLLMLAAMRGAPAEEPHDHLFYSEECCGGDDCRPARPGEVERGDGGWYVTITKELILDDRTLTSQDPRFHICLGSRTRNYVPYPFVRCLYVPQMSLS